MALSTQTWRMSANYSYTIAGANPTTAELLAGLNAMIAAEATGGGKWGVSDYNAGNGTLEIKATGSPGGILGTFRALFFGGSSPNAAALGTSVAAASTTLYCGVSQDANTTGPSASYTAASPYTGKRWSGGVPIATNNVITKANSAVMFLVECTEMIMVFMMESGGCCSCLVGAVAEDIDSIGTPIWAVMTSGGALTTSSTEGSSIPTTTNFPITPFRGTSAPWGGWDNGSTKRQIGRGPTSYNPGGIATNGDGSLSAGGVAILTPVALMDSPQTTGVGAFKGWLRQIRVGPYMTHRQGIKDGSNVTQALFSGNAAAGTTFGIYFDQNP